ncbi:MAG TPA: redoxin domain-containing protein [Thermoanaerobaculia bacterium]|nr:redoxin domain-containing protein [Thermoanaerobaculia bacterium]
MPPITVPLHAPPFGPGQWIQGPEVVMAAARGSVVLVDFWDFTCINCLRTLPYLKAWHERYAASGLVVVGVHTPEFDFTGDAGTVAAAVRDLEIPYPVLLDDSRETWRLYANHYWPAKYLADSRGYLRYEHVGEGAYGYTEEWIQRLLVEAGDGQPMPPILAPLREEDRPGAVCFPATRETYIGYLRGKLMADEGYRPGEEVRHRGRAEPPEPGTFAARGLWRHEAEYLETREAGAELELLSEAAGMNLVAGSEDRGGGEVEIEVDGRPVPPEERGADVIERAGRTLAVWERPRMVSLLASPEFRRRRVRLAFLTPGTRAYTLSYTTCVQGPAPS